MNGLAQGNYVVVKGKVWPGTAHVHALHVDGQTTSFTVTVRVDTPVEAT